MTRDELLNKLATDPKIDRLISKMCANNAYLVKEGKQELFVVLCQLSEEKLFQLYTGEDNRLERWITGTLRNFFQRPSSPFYNKIIKFRKTSRELIVEDPDEDEEITDGNDLQNFVVDEPIGYTPEELEAAIDYLPHLDRLMIEHYLAEGTYVKVARKLSLNKVLVKRIVNRIKRDLRTILEPELVC